MRIPTIHAQQLQGALLPFWIRLVDTHLKNPLLSSESQTHQNAGKIRRSRWSQPHGKTFSATVCSRMLLCNCEFTPGFFWSNLDPGMPSQSGRHARVFQFLQHEDQDKMETDCSSRNQKWAGITAWSTVWLHLELKPSILQILVQATKLQLMSSGLWFLVALAIPRELQERDKGRENVSTHYYVFHKTTILLQLVMLHNFTTACCSNLSLPGDLGSQSRTTVHGWPVGRPPHFHSRWNWSSHQCVNYEQNHPSNFQDFGLNVLEGDKYKRATCNHSQNQWHEIYNHWSE